MCPFASTDQEAKEKFERFKSKDPFPSVYPALLNSADISDYVSATGMIYPFDKARLGPASYDMVVDGEYLYWDEAGKECHRIAVSDEPIKILKNSITYVTVDVKFRLPDYIALRFNFKIKHVHRGLLLGTGPLINPGFEGKLMIPIHNLTNNEYSIYKGDKLISVEFTKISQNPRWSLSVPCSEILPRPGKYSPNAMGSQDYSFTDYLKDELPMGVATVESSLSGTLSQARDSIENFKTLQNIAYGVAAGVIVGIIAILISTWALISDANNNVSSANSSIKEKINGGEVAMAAVLKDADILKKKVEDLEQRLANYESKFNVSRQDLQSEKIENLNNRILTIERQANGHPQE